VTAQTELDGDTALLSNNTSVRDYRRFERLHGKRKIAELIRDRFIMPDD
jgi:hypothetical protein